MLARNAYRLRPAGLGPHLLHCRCDLLASYPPNARTASNSPGRSRRPRLRANAAQQRTASSAARAVRPVHIKIVTVSKGSSRGADIMAEEWRNKLARYVPTSHIALKPNPKRASLPEAAVKAEGERVLASLGPRDFVVVLDERGKQATSNSFAQLIAQAGDCSASALVCCIGGPYGHAPDVRTRADVVMSLSGCVLNHSVAHVVLLEQLYRGWTILRGEPYHH